ncbi:hypothetical protein PTTW11_01046 [Pyrenophora teres f. teres]|uniref:PCI domain-containing protein n=1 Tax=Pyrenophora teres f. teres TaxID=97479 RepID=A0A6S6VUZ1_9PLEO|nr:hypothetical protein PTNB29_05662 [Pyrenophora teres f. teres]CAA9957400.1 hypothetical protein PTMSG1_01008 [Pyrenophora teres f. maculata]CAE7000254.1 hypothetical protein PTTW11_01046 [Pyrenophora teres f. teres]
MAFVRSLNDVETRLCTAVNVAIQKGDAHQLQSIVLLEPGEGGVWPPDHQELVGSLRMNYSYEDEDSEQRLEDLVRRVVTETAESEDEEGRPVQSWSSLVTFLVGWMTFLRDVDIDDLVLVFELMTDLQSRANSALQHPTKGIMMLPTIMYYAKVFARVAIGLDKRPDLAQELMFEVDEDGQRESLPEKAANIVRQAFIICLNDRNTVPGGIKDGKPDGKKVGIYKMANICLRTLFQADKLGSCETIFNNISNSSPPLHIYPAAERITYLYYLGRYHFSNTNFYAAQLVLEIAYRDCHRQCLQQRRLIAVLLVAANIILGRIPNEMVYSDPANTGFREAFQPLTQAIRRGDLETFRRITNLDLSHPSSGFMIRYNVFYPIGNYCEPLVWRSLLRKVFILTAEVGDKTNAAALLDLNACAHIFQYLETRSLIKNATMAAQAHDPRRSMGHVYQDYASTTKSTYIDPDFEGVDDAHPYTHQYDELEMECICGSLITQGFLNAYIAQAKQKMAVQGVKGGDLNQGFLKPWKINKENNDDEVLGWKKEAGGDGGKVVRLSFAAPAGS